MAYEKTQVTAMGFKSTATYFKKEHWTDFDLIKASLTKWLYVRLSGCGFKSRCTHLNFRCHVCSKQRVPWRSGNFRVEIHSVHVYDMIKIHISRKLKLIEPLATMSLHSSKVFRKTVWNFNFLRNMKKIFLHSFAISYKLCLNTVLIDKWIHEVLNLVRYL